MKPSCRWTAFLPLFAAILLSACDPKDKLKGDDGHRGAQGEQGDPGPAGPAGPPGSNNAWSRTGNAGTVAGSEFLGTTDNVPFEIWVNGSRLVHLDPEVDGGTGYVGGNFVSGSFGNSVTPGAIGCTVEGGGSISGVPRPNIVTDNYCTVSGGYGNRAGDNTGSLSSAHLATVGGGGGNIAGGQQSTVGGGDTNVASGAYSTVCGGGLNSATGKDSFIGGGDNNIASGVNSTIAAGDTNSASGPYSAIGGGYLNAATKTYSTVAGGWANSATGEVSFVGAGYDNDAASDYSVVAGGSGNRAFMAPYSAILGGFGSTASGKGSSIPGGIENEAMALCALAAGRRAKSQFDGSFVWADVSSVAGVDGDPFRSDARANQFNAFASGGVRLVTRYDSEGSPVASAELAPGGSSWLSLLDRPSVTSLQVADPREVLARLRRMPISTYSFAAQDASIRHMGPLAEDFSAAFGLGESDRHIGHIDADGVALASIQGLALELDARDARIAALEVEGNVREARTLEMLVEKNGRIASLESSESESARKIAELEARLARLERILEAAGSK